GLAGKISDISTKARISPVLVEAPNPPVGDQLAGRMAGYRRLIRPVGCIYIGVSLLAQAGPIFWLRSGHAACGATCALARRAPDPVRQHLYPAQYPESESAVPATAQQP